MKLGLTGGTGFLGSHLCPRLVGAGHDVRALRRPARAAQVLDRLGIESLVGDITDPTCVEELIAGCDAVVHAAGSIRQGRAFRDENKRVNVLGTSVVARACKRAGVPLLHVSSVAAIGVPDGLVPVDETFRWNMEADRLSYHHSKRIAEGVVLDAVADGLEAVIVNPSSMLGPCGSKFRGSEVPDGVQRRRFVPYFVGGTNVVHVDDVVEGILSALRDGRNGHRYILGGENLSWRELAEIAADELGVRRAFVPVPPAAYAAAVSAGGLASRLVGARKVAPDRYWLGSRHLYYDSAKARTELGYGHRTYREIVREYVEGGWHGEVEPVQHGGIPDRASHNTLAL